MSSSSLLLLNWLDEVAFEVQRQSQRDGPLERLLVAPEATDAMEVEEETIKEYEEVERLCPFNIKPTLVIDDCDAPTAGAGVDATTAFAEESSSTASAEAAKGAEAHVPLHLLGLHDLSSTATPSSNAAARHSTSQSTVTTAQLRETVLLVTPERPRLNVIPAEVLSSNGGDEQETAGHGLSPEYRSRKSSTTAVSAVGNFHFVNHPPPQPAAAPPAALNPSNLDIVSRKAYYSPGPPSVEQSPSVTATSSPRRRCWVDLPEQTTALFDASVSGHSGRLQRTSTLTLNFPSPGRSTGVNTPAAELQLGEAAATAAAAVTFSTAVDAVGVVVAETSSTVSSSILEDDAEVVQVVSWLEPEPEVAGQGEALTMKKTSFHVDADAPPCWNSVDSRLHHRYEDDNDNCCRCFSHERHGENDDDDHNNTMMTTTTTSSSNAALVENLSLVFQKVNSTHSAQTSGPSQSQR